MDVLEAARVLAASSPEAVRAAGERLADAGGSVGRHGSLVLDAMPSGDQWSGYARDAYVGSARELGTAAGALGNHLTAGGQALLAYASALAAARAGAVEALRRAAWARQVAALVVRVGAVSPAAASSYARTATTAWGQAQQEAGQAWSAATGAAQALQQALQAQGDAMSATAAALGSKDFGEAMSKIGMLYALPAAAVAAGATWEGLSLLGRGALVATTVGDIAGGGSPAPDLTAPANPAAGRAVEPAESGPRPGEVDYYQFKVGEHELVHPGPEVPAGVFAEAGGFASVKLLGGHGDGPGATAGLLYGGGVGGSDGLNVRVGLLHEHTVGYDTGADGRLHAVDERETYLNPEVSLGPFDVGVLVNDKGIAVYRATETRHGVFEGDGISVVVPEAVTDEIADTLRFVGERMSD